MDTFTISYASPERIVLEIALEQYLHGYSAALIEASAPNSAVRHALHVYNRLRNIANGTHVEYGLDRLPTSIDKFKTTHERIAL